MGIRDEKASQTKNKIIEAAKELIKEKGLSNVSVDDITKQAGVAKGSFYVYFKKKEDIVGEIGCMEFRYINEELNNMNNLNIKEKLNYYAKRYKDGVLELGIEISKCWLQNNLNCRCKLEYDYSAISNIIKDAIKNNELKNDTNVSILTYKIISALYGLMLIWIMSDGSIRVEDMDDVTKFSDILIPYIEEVENERI
ncbi:MAG: TetR/AcrR family transcriptional regulator [Acholeplasmatales bacterium]|nr:TetR/AcrR family transcriptional regulator [Acholeplasmatales bacterium]